jgi:hypothetical protein
MQAPDETNRSDDEGSIGIEIERKNKVIIR